MGDIVEHTGMGQSHTLHPLHGGEEVRNVEGAEIRNKITERELYPKKSELLLVTGGILSDFFFFQQVIIMVSNFYDKAIKFIAILEN